jgi:hypothetical protein
MEATRWTIREWRSNSCPEDAFKIGHDLILKEGSDSYTLAWVNEECKLCWIDDLPKPMGRSHQVPVYFGSEFVFCEVTLNRSEGWLTGTLKPGNDGSAGMFGAEANGPLPG